MKKELRKELIDFKNFYNQRVQGDIMKINDYDIDKYLQSINSGLETDKQSPLEDNKPQKKSCDNCYFGKNDVSPSPCTYCTNLNMWGKLD